MRLQGKVALVTGGGSGIGAEISRSLAREGAKVAVADIADQNGERTVREIEQAGGDAIFIHLDVTQEEQWKKAIATTEQHFGKLNVLVNNAGISVRKLVENAELEDWHRIMEVNATGTWLGIKHAIPAMRRAGGGSIINMSSAHAIVGDIGHPAYFASKAGVRLLTKATAVQHAKDNICCNSIHPGFVETPMTAEFHASGARQYREAKTPLGRLATPEDIAPGAVFLASDESRYMTGSELVIDGGVTAQ